MKKEKARVNTYNQAIKHLQENETNLHVFYGDFNGKINKKRMFGNGVFIGTNKRLFVYTWGAMLSLNYIHIEVSTIEKKKIIGNYKGNKFTISVPFEEEAQEAFNFLTSKKEIATDPFNFEEYRKIKQIVETKRTCTVCGETWYYDKGEPMKNFGEKMENVGSDASNMGSDMMCCTGCLPAAFLPRHQKKEVRDLNECPNCGSKAADKETVVHDV